MSAFLEKHFYKLCVYLSFFKPSEPAVYDETLASSIKQSTQQRAKGRTKREDPSASHQKQNPNRVTKRGKGTKYVPEQWGVYCSISTKTRSSQCNNGTANLKAATIIRIQNVPMKFPKRK
jgi:hypothetical protein